MLPIHETNLSKFKKLYTLDSGILVWPICLQDKLTYPIGDFSSSTEVCLCQYLGHLDRKTLLPLSAFSHLPQPSPNSCMRLIN